MHVEAHLDVDVVAVETDDEVSLLIELTAPASAPDPGQRPVRTLQVVLDRSGSMGGGRLEGAVRALLALVDRLDPVDNFGLVVFDDDVALVVPAGPLTGKDAVKRAIAALSTGGSTNLSAAICAGCRRLGGWRGRPGPRYS